MNELKTEYERKIWLNSYPENVSPEAEIPEVSLHEAFDRATEKWKNKTAVIFYGEKISYGDLRERVDRFAAALSDLGIRKGDVVALLLLNCPEHIVAFYGLLKVGAILTPISPVYVSPEIKHQIADSGAKAIVCQDIFWEKVEKTGLAINKVILTNIGESLPISKKLIGKSILRGLYQKMAVPQRSILKKEGFYEMRELINKYPPKIPKIEVNVKEDLVQLPYTGGTTGPPKGVMLTHYNHLASFSAVKAFYPFWRDGEEVWLSYMPFYHAAGQFWGIIVSIIRGWTQVLLSSPDPEEIINNIIIYKINSFLGAPAMFEILKTFQKTNRVNWEKLKIIISGADALHEATIKDWELRTKTKIHDCWGMTETIATGIYTPLGKQRAGSIGLPMPNNMAAIIDLDRDEFVPVGELGELIIKGPQVTKGYWNNSEETKNCQVTIRNETWFRTGDLGSMDQNGYFYIYDRKRDLIKYKGLRVYVREVEEVLKTHPKVKEVGVIGVPDISVGQNIKAFVVLEREARGKVSEAEIMEYCKDKLAHYKIPKVIEFVGEIPRTDVGKVSRRELREIEY
jgi:long-chain acyl-CoA synthetase